jgi:hypothetical protein
MKTLLLITLLTSFSFSSTLFSPLFANKKAKSVRVREGGRFYKQSKIQIGKGPIVSSFLGDSYNAYLCPKGVISIYLKQSEQADKKPALLIEAMWEDSKNKKAEDALLSDLKWNQKNDTQWTFNGSFDSPKGDYQAEVSFDKNGITVLSDASTSKTGELKLTITVTNFRTVHKTSKGDFKKLAQNAKFSGITQKKKKMEDSYPNGELKTYASQKFSKIDLKNHYPMGDISFDSSKAEGFLDIKAYGGGVTLLDGFNVRYQTPAKGKMNLKKNSLSISFQ